ncbi:hypothetical protein Pla52o_03850 [Novipirellula galeiformis]|uniref:Ada DNA repair metal-binding domain-containing protein n=1 Tax=Novipirellula galeiformis TaxID=2528004 RepID=A0A5C6CPX8_9BACT|nr:hypothetical protein Pla52o_03850 [Novipirellula galeiformis]
MPLQNRVTPASEIIAVADRGLFMGNRGCLHNDQKQLVRPVCSVKRWIICQLQFRDRRRSLMTPNQYTELFFLDEATALAAGHRPCAECRRQAYNDFKKAWLTGNPQHQLGHPCSIDQIDAVLQQDRWDQEVGQKTFQTELGSLPGGVIVSLPNETAPCLWVDRSLLRWSAGRYDRLGPATQDQQVKVHTPRSTVQALRAGFKPIIHPSRHGSR